VQGNTAADAAGSASSQLEAAAVVAATAVVADEAAAAAPSSSSSSSSSAGGVSLLTSAEPIDRLRYQAVLVFEHFDTAKAGQLTADQVQQFFTSSARKVSSRCTYMLKQQREYPMCLQHSAEVPGRHWCRAMPLKKCDFVGVTTQAQGMTVCALWSQMADGWHAAAMWIRLGSDLWGSLRCCIQGYYFRSLLVTPPTWQCSACMHACTHVCAYHLKLCRTLLMCV
jgi:hypothetical protein